MSSSNTSPLFLPECLVARKFHINKWKLPLKFVKVFLFLFKCEREVERQ